MRALPKVRVFELLELFDQLVHFLRHCPLGVAALLGYRDFGIFRDMRIGQDHPVHIEKGAEFSRSVVALHPLVQGLELLPYSR